MCLAARQLASPDARGHGGQNCLSNAWVTQWESLGLLRDTAAVPMGEKCKSCTKKLSTRVIFFCGKCVYFFFAVGHVKY